MKRDIKKLIEEYNKLEEQHKGFLYYEDIQQIHDLSNDAFDYIWNAYKVGVAVGYRIRKREDNIRNKQNKRK